jgi:hypothetical protein
MRRRIHACHLRRRMHACHMTRVRLHELGESMHKCQKRPRNKPIKPPKRPTDTGIPEKGAIRPTNIVNNLKKIGPRLRIGRQVCMYVYIHTYVCMCVYIRMYVCIHTYVYVCMYVCIYVCMYVCMYAYVCMYIYIHTYVRT